MQLIDNLRAEHALIEQVAGALRTYVERRAAGAAGRDDGHAFFNFLRRYVGEFHHGREEEVLFPALVAAELPADRGPLAALRGQHASLGAILEALASELEREVPGPKARELACSYARGLGRHIDAEGSVLFPEAEARLARAAIAEPVERACSPEQAAARAEGERLVATYPPEPDPEAVRGEGCVVCEAYGSGCDGVEREWWNDSEWEELPHRVG